MRSFNPPAEAVVGSRVATAPQIWAVGGGKGGVGKSFVAANMGLALAKHGKRVALVDLDLGGANLHTSLGISGTDKTLSDYFNGKTKEINDLVCSTGFERIGLISGAGDTLHIANLKHFQKVKLLRNLRQLHADYVILDLGAGTSFNMLDFFVHADRGVLTVTPNPASIENSYRFLKCALMRKLSGASFEAKKTMNELLQLRRQGGARTGTLADILSYMDEHYAEHAPQLRRELATLKLHLIVNQVQEPRDTELGQAMKMACNRYFDADVDYLGYLQYDQHVLQSLKERKPFIISYPQSRATIHFEHMTSTLLSMDQKESE